MQQYPIWLDVYAPDYKSDKSFGAKNSTEIDVYVGSSRTYSYNLGKLKIARQIRDNVAEFSIFLDGKAIKTLVVQLDSRGRAIKAM